MRSHKHRGKRKDNGEWIYGMPDFTYANNGEVAISYVDDKDCYCIAEVYPETVGESTELTDINKKEIYEGDIVESVSWNEYISRDGRTIKVLRRCMVVEFHEGGFRLKEIFNDPALNPVYWDISTCPGDLKVIGNIHDNPELLTNT